MSVDHDSHGRGEHEAPQGRLRSANRLHPRAKADQGSITAGRALPHPPAAEAGPLPLDKAAAFIVPEAVLPTDEDEDDDFQVTFSFGLWCHCTDSSCGLYRISKPSTSDHLSQSISTVDAHTHHNVAKIPMTWAEQHQVCTYFTQHVFSMQTCCTLFLQTNSTGPVTWAVYTYPVQHIKMQHLCIVCTLKH